MEEKKDNKCRGGQSESNGRNCVPNILVQEVSCCPMLLTADFVVHCTSMCFSSYTGL